MTKEIKEKFTIYEAIVRAQAEMSNALKDSSNPYYKSKYSDFTSVRGASIPALNKYGIAVLQPIIQKDGKSYVKTILLHESGSKLEQECDIEILFGKPNDPQAQGSGITYARRYALQSLLAIASEDDDGNAAIKKENDEVKTKVNIETINKEQQKEISKLVSEAKIPNFLNLINLENVSQIPVSKYDGYLKRLKDKIKENQDKAKLEKENQDKAKLENVAKEGE
jgi:hypothetical protein